MNTASQADINPGTKATVTASPVKAAHTPLPWKMARVHPDPETAAQFIELFPMRGGVRGEWNSQSIACLYCAEAGGIQEANAELIVRAVNNHDALVTALQNIIREAGPDAGKDEEPGTINAMARIARAAIAAATLA